ncbi:hypothetical protein G9A89_023833 [Geosiphon pyriformis]|nr:hypothetical protein G9A89_023833 [Geosiphon pyriformis]
MASKEEKEEDQEFNYQNLIAENLEVETPNIQTQQTQNNPNPNLLVIPENILSNNWELNQNKLLISNILSATITNNELLAVIFSFEFEEPSQTLLFSRAVLKEKPITIMYTNAKINGQAIKLILNSGLIGNIIT